MSFARPLSERSSESSGAVTVVAQYAPTPWRARNAPMWLSAESVASITS